MERNRRRFSSSEMATATLITFLLMLVLAPVGNAILGGVGVGMAGTSSVLLGFYLTNRVNNGRNRDGEDGEQ